MGKGFQKKKKQARMMQEQLAKFQEQMQNTEVTGSAGNGLVTITLTGENEMKKVTIKPDCVDPEDVEGLEDLIKAAYKDARNKLTEQSPAPGGLPGLPPGGGFPDLSGLGF
ncbi:MAG: Nucleoid-associated protein [Chlamydiae bacterium]|nr:Nucleoid-associated protein [Chlamydiota bacterium]